MRRSTKFLMGSLWGCLIIGNSASVGAGFLDEKAKIGKYWLEKKKMKPRK